MRRQFAHLETPASDLFDQRRVPNPHWAQNIAEALEAAGAHTQTETQPSASRHGRDSVVRHYRQKQSPQYIDALSRELRTTTTRYNRSVRSGGGWHLGPDCGSVGRGSQCRGADDQYIYRVSCACISMGPVSQPMESNWVGREAGLRARFTLSWTPRACILQLGLRSGETHDNRLCSVPLTGLHPRTMLLADRGYDADWITALASQQGFMGQYPAEMQSQRGDLLQPLSVSGATHPSAFGSVLMSSRSRRFRNGRTNAATSDNRPGLRS